RKEDIPLLFRKFASDFSEKYRTYSVQLDPAAQQLLVNYPWNGNVRELKNIAEQVSVLSKEKTITAEALSRFLPHKENRAVSILPSHSSGHGDGNHNYFSGTERDILYKLFFDLKKDITDIKQMMLELAHRQGYNNPMQENLLPAATYHPPKESPNMTPAPYQHSPIFLPQDSVDQHEEVEESLMLAERE